MTKKNAIWEYWEQKCKHYEFPKLRAQKNTPFIPLTFSCRHKMIATDSSGDCVREEPDVGEARPRVSHVQLPKANVLLIVSHTSIGSQRP